MNSESGLIESVQSGAKDTFNEIIRRYDPLLRSSVDRYIGDDMFLASDRDDLYQEATIALYGAVMSYDTHQSEVTFGLYAKICLNNSLNSALRRQKRIRLAEKSDGQSESNHPYSTGTASELTDDAGLLMKRIEAILSPFEMTVFQRFIHGVSHREIAAALGKPEKSIDNAVYRIRQKLSRKLL